MTNWTEKQAADYLQAKKNNGIKPESALQNKITAWAKAHGYPCLSMRKGKYAYKAGFPPGWPDIVLALPKGRTVYIELKRQKDSKTYPEQKQMKLMLMQLGHEIYICKTWKKFIEIVGNDA